MVENENFDNFLREKGEAANFAFTENDWALAKGLIAIKTQEARRKKFLIVGITVMISLSVLFSLLCNHYLPLRPEKKLETNLKKPTSFSNNEVKGFKDLKRGKNIMMNQAKLPLVSEAKESAPSKTNSKNSIRVKIPLQNKFIDVNTSQNLIGFNNEEVLNTLIDDINLIESHKLNPLPLKEVFLPFSANLVNTFNQKLPKSKVSPFHYWLDAGLTFYNPGNDFVSNLNFYAGIEANFDFSKKFGLQSGFIFSRLNQNQQERVINERVFSFGVINQTKTIRTILLDYIEVLMTLRYYISPRQSFQAGISLMYVVNSSEVLKTSRDNELGNDEVSLLNNFRTHVNDFDYQLQFKHNYLIGKKLMLNTGFYYGLNDISKNDGNNIGLRLGLGYQLF